MNPLTNQGAFLGCLQGPGDIKKLSLAELKRLADEIRAQIIEVVAANGGHLASSLGVVELTLALHYVFDAPADKIIWDVGHQSYAHKLITGRQKKFCTLRRLGGLSGFPKRSESGYDSFDTGHSSTSISAGLGIATAKAFKGEKNKVIAVIGDGSLTAGMAFEGLNQAGHTEKDLIVVLNDNDMSISPNVGAFSSFMSRKTTGQRFVNIRKELMQFLGSLPGIGENMLTLLQKSEELLTAFFTPAMLFEALKFKYVGPINGHRLDQLIETFNNMYNLEGPVLVHVCTVKGKGYGPAEKDPSRFHGIGSFTVASGASLPSEGAGQKKPPSYTHVFGKTMVELAALNDNLFAITAAMPDGTGLSEFARAYPDRFVDVGIAEQHAVTFSAGLATEGLRPVVAIYSTFLQRAYDQIIHDVCLPNLPVIFAIDRSGLVGEDGPTHHGQFDISYLRVLPNMTVMAPKDENELRHMLHTALQHNGPSAIRYPRGKAIGVAMDRELKLLPHGRAEILREGRDVLILTLGSMVYPCLAAAELLGKAGCSAGVVNCRYAKPLDAAIARFAAETKRVLVVEENAKQGGLGSAVVELLIENNALPARIALVGLPDAFVEHGPVEALKQRHGLTPEAIVREAQLLCSSSQGPCDGVLRVMHS